MAFDDSWLIERNLELTRHLNPAFEGRWIVVDNSPGGNLALPAGAEILPGVARPRAPDMGSTHHALALHRALAEVRTRYVLLLDHDFYVVRPDWIAQILAHAHARRLSVFGSAWNPRWFYQYRGFPSVHFLLIDLNRIPVGEIDLMPAAEGDVWWRVVNTSAVPLPGWLRDTLKAGRLRDIGWHTHRRFAANPHLRVETLVPHYIPPATLRYRWERRTAAWLPESWRKYPVHAKDFTERSELRNRLPRAYEAGWEELFWRGALFAVHLRRVGRKWTKRSLEDDEALLDALLHSARHKVAP